VFHRAFHQITGMISQQTHEALRAWSLGLALGCVSVFLASGLAQGAYPGSVVATAFSVVLAAGAVGFLDPHHPGRAAGSVALGVVVYVAGRLLYDGATGRFDHPAPLGELALAALAGVLPALLGAFAASSLRRTLAGRRAGSARP